MGAIRLYKRFQDIPDALLAHLDAAGMSSDFALTPAWLCHLADTARDERQQLRLYCMEHGDGAGLLLPMYGMRCKWPGSRRLVSQANYYSALAGPLYTGREGGAMREMIAAIAAERPRWSSIDLRPLPVDGTAFVALEEGLRAAGMVVQRYFCFGNWYLEVGTRSYADYLAGLPSRLRNTLARKTPQLEAAGRVDIEIVTGGAQLEGGIADYEAVYGASWKQPEPFPHFIPGLIRLCAQRGSLRLGIVRINGTPVAAQIWIVHNSVASIYKLAYDGRFSALSVGTILTARMMRHVIDIDRVREVDYLMGDDPYKQDWMSHRRERWGLIGFNPRTIAGALAVVRHCGARALRRLLSSIATNLHQGKKKPVLAWLSKAIQAVATAPKYSVFVMLDRLKK